VRPRRVAGAALGAASLAAGCVVLGRIRLDPFLPEVLLPYLVVAALFGTTVALFDGSPSFRHGLGVAVLSTAVFLGAYAPALDTLSLSQPSGLVAFVWVDAALVPFVVAFAFSLGFAEHWSHRALVGAVVLAPFAYAVTQTVLATAGFMTRFGVVYYLLLFVAGLLVGVPAHLCARTVRSGVPGRGSLG